MWHTKVLEYSGTIDELFANSHATALNTRDLADKPDSETGIAAVVADLM